MPDVCESEMPFASFGLLHCNLIMQTHAGLHVSMHNFCINIHIYIYRYIKAERETRITPLKHTHRYKHTTTTTTKIQRTSINPHKENTQINNATK